MTVAEVRTTAMAVGGEAVARDRSGRVVFVAGALPDETLRVEIVQERRSFARAAVLDVVDPAPGRVHAPCPHVEEGCGGCDWQHATPATQRDLRLGLVADALARMGGIAEPAVAPGARVPVEGVRTTLRGTAGPDGRFALRRRRSHEPVPVGSCLVAHPLVEEIVAEGSFVGARDITIRVGGRTGDRLVVAGPTAAGVRVPTGVVVVGRDELAAGRRAWLHEEAAGRRWRVSADSFFQASPEGAEALVCAAASLVAEHAPGSGPMVDLCCGVGLFGGTLAAGRRLVGVERGASAVADARHNLVDHDARIVKASIERWRPSPVDVVVADPARRGLGARGAASVAATGARLCVLVSCDPASLGRDAAALGRAGFEHVGSRVIDLFGHTSHVEAVSGFRAVEPPGTAPR